MPTSSVYIPLSTVLPNGIWPEELLSSPVKGTGSFLNRIACLYFDENVEEDGYHISILARVMAEVRIPLLVLDGMELVFGKGSTDDAGLLNIDCVVGTNEGLPTVDLSIETTTLSLDFRTDIFRPVKQETVSGKDTQFIPTSGPVSIALPKLVILIHFDGHNWSLDFEISVDDGQSGLALPLCEIGSTGVYIEATGLTLNLNGSKPNLVPHGAPRGWKGVFLSGFKLYLPKIYKTPFTSTDIGIGTGGFYGKISLPEQKDELKTSLFGMAGGISKVQIEFTQNVPTAFTVEGSLILPFFEQRVSVSIAIDGNGGFAIALRDGINGIKSLAVPDLLTLKLESIGFAVTHGDFIATISGSIKINKKVGGRKIDGKEVDGPDWPEVKIRNLTIDSHGNVQVPGGWLDLPQQYHLNLHGFQFEMTKLGFGGTEDGGKWIGFSGGLKLIEKIAAGISVEGLRITWYPGKADLKPTLSLNGVGIEFNIPKAMKFKGDVSYNDRKSEFAGSIQLDIVALKLKLDGQIVIGFNGGSKYFAIYLGVDLPSGIPLFSTGLALYGIAGLFAIHMEPKKEKGVPWYAMPKAEDWFHKPQEGVNNLNKWTNNDTSTALGAGVTLGTVSDNGYAFAGRLLLVMIFPGPIILIEGSANILKERSSLADEANFRALAVIDNRKETFLVGLDAKYRLPDSGGLIDISGSAEAFFDFNDPDAWHIYLGVDEPRDRRIRARVYDLFDADAYLMLDAHQLATGGSVGLANSWDFGPVHLGLQVWLEGGARVSFKPFQFHGDLWLHGNAEFRVFGFGFGIGISAMVAADAFQPKSIKIELKVHLEPPWPFPDVDVALTLQWGPEKTRPRLPQPLKEVTIEHLKVKTTWPLQRSKSLLVPNYDDREAPGLLVQGQVSYEDDTSQLENAPIVPMDARPSITFGQPVRDDAFCGINSYPQRSLRIGDTEVATSLTEITLQKWVVTWKFEKATGVWEEKSGQWETVASRASPRSLSPQSLPLFPGPILPLSSVARATPLSLYGSWAPLPDLSDPDAKETGPVVQTKLWLWSKNPFNYAQSSASNWNAWFRSQHRNYPCVPILEDYNICCDFTKISKEAIKGLNLACPEHPTFILHWTVQPLLQNGLHWSGADEVILHLGDGVKSINLVITSDTGLAADVCFENRPETPLPDPLFEHIVFEAFYNGINHIVKKKGVTGLDMGRKMRITSPFDASKITIEYIPSGRGVKFEALDRYGEPVKTIEETEYKDGHPILSLKSAQGSIKHIVATWGIESAGSDNGTSILLHVHVELDASSVVAVGVTQNGREMNPVPIVDGMAQIDNPDLRAVIVRGNGIGFTMHSFCAVLGLSTEEVIRRKQMAEHLKAETDIWKQPDTVLEPYTKYRLRIITHIAVKNWKYESDNPFTEPRDQTHYAFFRTHGPPGLTKLTLPCVHPNPDTQPLGEKFDGGGLSDLTRYVRQTIPPTVPEEGKRPLLPHPVYRSYDVGVDFNENYVSLLYSKSHRDLRLYLFDNNNQPARDIFDHLFVRRDPWEKADRVLLTATDLEWTAMVNASKCLHIDVASIARTEKIKTHGQTLNGDTLYEARLTPLLLHETFGVPFMESQSAIGNGDKIAGLDGDWTVQEIGSLLDTSRWVVGTRGATGTSYIEKQEGMRRSSIALEETGTVLIRDQVSSRLPEIQYMELKTQSGLWTDYRLTATLHSLNSGTLGLVFRWQSPRDFYLFVMNRQHSFRRMIQVKGGKWALLAHDDVAYNQNTDYFVTIEAIGTHLRVYVNDDRVFDEQDSTHVAGGIGLFASEDAGARFKDVCVDDFRAQAPSVYRFQFTTSRFANFYHHICSGTGAVWSQELTEEIKKKVDLSAAVHAATETTGLSSGRDLSEMEISAYRQLAKGASLNKADMVTARVEITKLVTKIGEPGNPLDRLQAVGLFIRTAEPVDWTRTNLYLEYATGLTAAYSPMPDPVPANGSVMISEWSTAPGKESVTLLLDDTTDLSCYRIEYRILPGVDSVPRTRLKTEAFAGKQAEYVPSANILFAPVLNDLSDFIVYDPTTRRSSHFTWSAAKGKVTLRYLAATDFLPNLPESVIQSETFLLTYRTFRDVRLSVTVSMESTAADQGGIGLFFRYRDSSNWYRLCLFPNRSARSLSESLFGSISGTLFRSLVKCVNGVTTVLWSDTIPMPIQNAKEKEYRVVVRTVGGDIEVQIDGREVVRIFDTSHTDGQIGLYGWQCRSAYFRNFRVEDQTRLLKSWHLYDIGMLITPSRWKWENGMLMQLADLAGSDAHADATLQGAYAITGEAGWSDVHIATRIYIDSPDAAGIAFRWNGVADHYLLILDSRNNMLRLVRKERGLVKTLWEQSGRMTIGMPYDVVIEAIGSRLCATVNGGTTLFDLSDEAHSRGKAGVFVCATSSVRFELFTIDAALPQWKKYYTFPKGKPLAAGTRVRLYAGKESEHSELAIPNEVRLYQGDASSNPSSSRLPVEGVDLRLVSHAPERIVHALRGAPGAEFSRRVANVLRSQDGTGLILFVPDAESQTGSHMPMGLYRLCFTYRRDNTSINKDSLVLTENGDYSPEVAVITVRV